MDLPGPTVPAAAVHRTQSPAPTRPKFRPPEHPHKHQENHQTSRALWRVHLGQHAGAGSARSNRHFGQTAVGVDGGIVQGALHLLQIVADGELLVTVTVEVLGGVGLCVAAHRNVSAYGRLVADVKVLGVNGVLAVLDGGRNSIGPVEEADDIEGDGLGGGCTLDAAVPGACGDGALEAAASRPLGLGLDRKSVV